jgi:outer membrane protein assembly factor BamB
LTCFELETGKLLWEKDLKTNFQASASLVGNKIYLMSEKGETVIIESSREYKELGRCKLNEGGLASPAFMDNRIYVRTKDHLYCLGAKN